MSTNKTRKVTIWWVDDDFLRSAHAGNKKIAERYERDRRIRVNGTPPLEFVQRLTSEIGQTADLFLVDYRLNDHQDEHGKRYSFTGTALAGNIRDVCPEHPIYLVSRILSNENVLQDSEYFDLQLTYASLNSETTRDQLISDALDYRSLRSLRNRQSVSALLRLLAVPKNSRNQLSEALPIEFKDGMGAPTQTGTQLVAVGLNLGSAIRYSRWVRRVFLRFPGLLYDDLYAATFLGMNERAFQKRFAVSRGKATSVKGLQYSGIFARSHARRWWKNSIAEFVYGLAAKAKQPVGNVWELAPVLLQLPKTEMARCVNCGEHYPETVAYDPDDPTVRKPVHWRCSTIDQNHNPSKHFEQLRIFHR